MGYITTYGLGTIGGSVDEDELKKVFAEVNSGYFEGGDIVDELLEGWFDAKWYD